MDFQVSSGLFPGVIGIIWIQYATYFHLGPISGWYQVYSQVICRQYLGYLPFTAILPEVSGLPYPRSTETGNPLLH